MPDRSPSSGPAALATLDSEALRDVEQALATEWIEPDGTGGFAMGSVLGLPVRRQHGLLVLRPNGLERRHVLLTSLGETLEVLPAESDQPTELVLDATFREGRFERTGHLALEAFALEPAPRWTLRTGDVVVRRELVRSGPTLLMRWTLLEGPTRARLRLEPRLGPREADQLTERNAALDATVDLSLAGLRVRPYAGLPALHFTVGGSPLEARVAPAWQLGHQLPLDQARGYEGSDDLWTPGELAVELRRGQAVVLAVGVDAPVAEPLRAFDAALAERTAASRPAAHPGLARLERAARRFLYRDTCRPAAPRRGVIAGYPWLAEWGRDTFIALPGLTLAHDDLDGCRDVLLGAVDRIEGGLVPTHFGADPDSDHFAGADTSLWFARAVRLYERAGGERALLVTKLAPALVTIAERYLEGTELGIHADAQGLLHVGSPTLATTWMDARLDGLPCTPRHGHPVEIQALWFALLAHLESWCYERGGRRDAERYADVLRRASTAFVERFCDGDRLADVWRPEGADHALRPNMVVAA
ncbi:MAG: amylo-alpha-1,6-glucosidase, partial [Planctomycetota bacterium]